jgi:hypothetical protein
MILSIFGAVIGIVAVIAIGRFSNLPTEADRGYANAFAVGLLIVAAIDLIPTALNEVTFLMSELFLRFAPFLTQYESIPWSIIVPGLTQALAIIVVFKAYLEGNGVGKADEIEAAVAQGKLSERRAVWHTRIGLPDPNQTDQAGISIILSGLVCFALWQGAEASVQSAIGWRNVSLVALAVLLSAAIIDHVPERTTRLQWLLKASSTVAVAWLLGMAGTAVVFTLSILIITIGAVTVIFSIGRTLRKVENKIGLGWQTTAAVAVTVIAVYGGQYLLRWQ